MWLLAVIAVDDEAFHTPGLEHRLEGVQILQVLDQLKPLVLREWLADEPIVMSHLRRGVGGVVREGVLRRVVSHVSTL